MLARYFLEISDDLRMPTMHHDPKWRPNGATLDSAKMPFTRVQIAVRNYCPD
jgi:hypothetical protein